MDNAVQREYQVPYKRPRPVVSCLECRRKKLKCDRTNPCRQCVRSGHQEQCTYQPGQEPVSAPSENEELHPPKRVRLTNSPDPRPEEVRVGIIEDLQARVARLEEAVNLKTRSSPPQASEGRHNDALSGADDDNLEHLSLWSRRITAINQFKEAEIFARKMMLSQQEDQTIKAISTDLRNLHVAIEAHELNHLDMCSSLDQWQVMQLLPDQETAESLVNLYFDNLEHCFRILHRPTFETQLKHFYNHGKDPGLDLAFMPQFVGVIAIASLLGTIPECSHVKGSRNSQLISNSANFLEVFLSSLKIGEKYQIPVLQVEILLMMLRWMRLDHIRDLWEFCGQILRHAMILGLDKDPGIDPSMNVLQAELRRKLWMSLVEQEIMLSILCSMPCMVPNFTCQPPRNVNDDELTEGSTTLPDSRPFDEWTDGLCQCFLAQSLSQRLEACNRISYNTLDSCRQMLQYTRSFERILQNLPRPLRFDHVGDHTGKAPARLMARMELDIHIRRHLLHLYSPFVYKYTRETCSEARAGFLQSCLMLTTYQDLFDPEYSEIDVPCPDGYWDFFFNVYRHELNQAVLGLCFEIQRLANKHSCIVTYADLTKSSPNGADSAVQSIPPEYSRKSCISSVKDTIDPMIRRISHYGANVKDLFCLTLVFHSVRSQPTEVEESIGMGLQDLVIACKAQLERDGVKVPDAQRQQNPGSSTSFITDTILDMSWTELSSF